MIRTIQQPAIFDHELSVGCARHISTTVRGAGDGLLHGGADQRPQNASPGVAASTVLGEQRAFPKQGACHGVDEPDIRRSIMFIDGLIKLQDCILSDVPAAATDRAVQK